MTDTKMNPPFKLHESNLDIVRRLAALLRSENAAPILQWDWKKIHSFHAKPFYMVKQGRFRPLDVTRPQGFYIKPSPKVYDWAERTFNSDIPGLPYQGGVAGWRHHADLAWSRRAAQPSTSPVRTQSKKLAWRAVKARREAAEPLPSLPVSPSVRAKKLARAEALRERRFQVRTGPVMQARLEENMAHRPDLIEQGRARVEFERARASTSSKATPSDLRSLRGLLSRKGQRHYERVLRWMQDKKTYARYVDLHPELPADCRQLLRRVWCNDTSRREFLRASLIEQGNIQGGVKRQPFSMADVVEMAAAAKYMNNFVENPALAELQTYVDCFTDTLFAGILILLRSTDSLMVAAALQFLKKEKLFASIPSYFWTFLQGFLITNYARERLVEQAASLGPKSLLDGLVKSPLSHKLAVASTAFFTSTFFTTSDAAFQMATTTYAARATSWCADISAMSAFIDLADHVVERLNNVLDTGDVMELFGSGAEVEFSRQCEEVLTGMSECRTKPGSHDPLVLLDYGHRLHENGIQKGYRTPAIVSLMSSLAVELAVFERGLALTRTPPLALMIVGPPGVGKTFLVDDLSALVKAKFPLLPRTTQVTFYEDEVKHQHLPAVPLVHVMNDTATIKDELREESLLLKLQKSIDIAPLHMEVASLAEKERSMISPNLFIGTTNSENFTMSQAVSGYDKLDRRLLSIHITWTQEALHRAHEGGFPVHQIYKRERASPADDGYVKYVIGYMDNSPTAPRSGAGSVCFLPRIDKIEFAQRSDFLIHLDSLIADQVDGKGVVERERCDCGMPLTKNRDCPRCLVEQGAFPTRPKRGDSLEGEFDEPDWRSSQHSFFSFVGSDLPGSFMQTIVEYPMLTWSDWYEARKDWYFSRMNFAWVDSIPGIDHVRSLWGLLRPLGGVFPPASSMVKWVALLSGMVYLWKNRFVEQEKVTVGVVGVPAERNPVEPFHQSLDGWIGARHPETTLQVKSATCGIHATVVFGNMVGMNSHFFRDRHSRQMKIKDGDRIQFTRTGCPPDERVFDSSDLVFGPEDTCFYRVDFPGQVATMFTRLGGPSLPGPGANGSSRGEAIKFGGGTYYSGGTPTTAGDCGAQIFDANGDLVGWHRGIEGGYKVLTHVSRGMALAARKELSDRGKLVCNRETTHPMVEQMAIAGTLREGLHPNSDMSWCSRDSGVAPQTRDHYPLGHVTDYPKARMSGRRTEMFETFAHLLPEEFGRPQTGKAKLDPNGVYVSAVTKRFDNMGRISQVHHPSMLWAVEHAIAPLRKVVPSQRIGPLTLHQAFVGDPNNVLMSPRDNSKAVGPSLGLQGITKKKCLVEQEDGRHEAHPVLMDLIETTEIKLRAGVLPLWMASANEKDELRPLSDVKAGKRRFFYVCDLHVNILLRKWILPILTFLLKNPLESKVTGTANAGGPSWGVLYDVLMKFGDGRSLDLDQKSFDLRHQALNAYYVLYMKKVASLIGYTSEEVEMVGMVISMTFSYVLIMAGEFYICSSGLCSGLSDTLVRNCIMNLLLVLYSFKRCGHKGDPWESLSLTNTGDDNATSVHPGCSFDGADIARVAATLGYEVTDGSKGSLTEFKTVAELVYLKRKWVFDGTHCWGPLSKASIGKSLCYTLASDVPERERNISTLVGNAKEFFLHGRVEYEAYVADVNTLPFPVRLPSYERLLEDYELGEFKTWDRSVVREYPKEVWTEHDWLTGESKRSIQTNLSLATASSSHDPNPQPREAAVGTFLH